MSILTLSTRPGLLLLILTVIAYQAPAQVIVIDPGHGYTSTGANPDGRTDTENATALDVGLKLRDQIRARCSQWTVYMTRSTRNGWVSLAQRRTMSNNWRADRFISIHCNAGGGSGTETFWCNRSNSADADNSQFSQVVQNTMVTQGQWTNRRSVEDASYIFHLGVLTGNNAVGVLNEIGFVDSGDANKLLNDTWRTRFAGAYQEALRLSLGGDCGGSPDTQPPTTSITVAGGTTLSGDFTATFEDTDDTGVTRRFYQVLEQYGSEWYANRGNGFFNDNYNVLYSGYTRGEGTWTIRNNRLRQSNTTSTNTSLSTFLSQNSGLPYLYEFSARVISTAGPRKFGLHIMADDAAQSQRGNSYLVWFSGEDNKVRVYETVDNQLFTRAISDVALDNEWANYKITYSPAYGVIEVFRNNTSLLRWTDASPLRTGSALSLRTNTTEVEFDDLKVYKFREGSRVTVTAGSEVTDDLRTASGRIKSLVRDAAGQWSAPGTLDVTITSGNASARVSASAEAVRVYPNPTDGAAVTLNYTSQSEQPTDISLLDLSGRVIRTMQDTPAGGQRRSVNLGEVLADVAPGYYVVSVRQGPAVQTVRLMKAIGNYFGPEAVL